MKKDGTYEMCVRHSKIKYKCTLSSVTKWWNICYNVAVITL
jgi:hypothetical protein